MNPDGLTINTLGGYCPCQGEGYLDGKEWYFRARGHRWTFVLSLDGRDPTFPKDGTWWRAAEYDPEGTGYSAGYMQPETAEQIIRKCADEYWQEKAAADGNC